MNPRVRVILQCRLSSARLPAKALLPLAGMPSALLAARRAANTGLEVVLATSDEAADDAVALLFARAGFRVVRGALNDVLARFTVAADGLGDNDIVVRITGDNALPDGKFIERVIAARAPSARYYAPAYPAQGLPYGVMAETFLVSALREASQQASTSYDREHVTPWIIRKYGDGDGAFGYAHLHAGLRATLDTLQDYQVLSELFANTADAENISWETLCAQLAALPAAAQAGGDTPTLAKLALGTVQIGMPYGVTNNSGQPDEAAALALVRQAVRRGVSLFDTARAYGSSEERLGRALRGQFAGSCRIVTKLDPLTGLEETAADQAIANAVDASIFRSLHALGADSLDTVLLHRCEHRHSHRGLIWQRLLGLRKEGVISKLGASIYTPAELRALAGDTDVACIQLPCNILDGRWDALMTEEVRPQRPDLEIHARSVLLQGLLVANAAQWPDMPGVDPLALIAQLDRMVVKFKRRDRLDLCLAHARGTPWLQRVILGVANAAQLDEAIAAFGTPEMSADARLEAGRLFAQISPQLLNPSLWPK